MEALLAQAPGVKMVDDVANKQDPMSLTVSEQFDVEVGKIRNIDVCGDCGLNLFVCGDQVSSSCVRV